MSESNRTALDMSYEYMMGAVQDWTKENNEEKVRKRVFELLDEKRDKTIMKLLGFTDAWGKGYELKGDGEIKAKLKPLVEAYAHTWLEKLELPEDFLPETFKKQIVNEYKREVRREVDSELYSFIDQTVKQIMAKFEEEILATPEIDGHIEFMKKLLKENHESLK